MDLLQKTFVLPENVSLGNIQKELEKQRGSFLGQAQAYPYWPLDLQQRMTQLRLAMLSTVVQTNVANIYSNVNDIAVYADFDEEDQENIVQVTVFGPRTADVIEGIENDFRAAHINWRLWSIELVASTVQWHALAKPRGNQFWTWVGVAFLRDQERRSFTQDIAVETSTNLFTDLQQQGLDKCEGAPASFQEWSNAVYETKRQLASDASLKNLSYDFLYYKTLRELYNSDGTDASVVFDLLCKCNFQRRIDFVLPSSAMIVHNIKQEEYPDCYIWGATVECFALSIGAPELQEKSFFALQWASLILKLEKARCRNASLCQEIYNLTKYAYRGAQLSDSNSTTNQLVDVERVVKNLPRVLLHDLVQTK